MILSLKPTHMRLLLGSNSPRRKELLALIDPDFAIAEAKATDETYPHDMAPHEVSPFLSKIKAQAYDGCIVPNEILITADTTVIDHGKILGKPDSEAEAVDMLYSLMGHSHEVVTGVTLTSIDKQVTFSELTEVTFDNVSKHEIELYVHNYHPLDKAGAYGIQEWIGCVGISGIKGCFYNVMGLPLHSLYQHLKKF